MQKSFGKSENALGVKGKVLMNVAANRKIVSLAEDCIGTRCESFHGIRVLFLHRGIYEMLVGSYEDSVVQHV